MKVSVLFGAALLASVLGAPWAAAQERGRGGEAANVADATPVDRFSRLAEVEDLMRTAGPQQALARVNELIDAHPDRAEPLVIRGQIYMATGMIQGAAEDFAAAIRFNPGEVFAQSNLARIEAQSGNIDAALARLDGALKKSPASAELRIAKADIEMARNNAAGAIKALEDADRLTNHPDAIVAINARLGNLRLHMQNWAGAEAAFDRVLAIRSDPQILMRRGDARFQQRKFSPALADYRAVQRTPFGEHPEVKPHLDQRLAAAADAADPVFRINPQRKPYYFMFLSMADKLAADRVRTRRAEGELPANYHCDDGAYVIYADEATSENVLGLGNVTQVPIRVVGQRGQVGLAHITIHGSLDSFMGLGAQLDFISVEDKDIRAQLDGRDTLAPCP